MEWNQLIANTDAALKAGQVSQATEVLRSVALNQVPREMRLPLAALCRRSGLWTEGLKLLVNIVRAKQGTPFDATEAEQAEYANLLMKVGSVREAKTLLRGLSLEGVPELKMYQSFCEIAHWNYEAAIPLLKEYLATVQNPYQAQIARVNLAAALVWTEKTTEADALLAALLEEAEKTRSVRLFANCLELQSQLFLQREDFERCEKNLARAEELLSSSTTSDQLFIRKWQAIGTAFRTRSTAPLEKLREEAEARQHWQTVRECDLHRLMISFEETLFQHLICGTPHASYRAKASRILGRPLPTGVYRWGPTEDPCLDLRTGDFSSGESLKGGKKIHQLVSILLRDFYKPLSISEIFSELCPDEYFDINTSPARIHQVITRSRRFFEAQKIPVTISTIEPGFSLQLRGPFSFRVPFDRGSVAGPLAQIEKLRQVGASEFSVDEVSHILNMSKPTARRILRWGVDQGHFVRFGAGPNTRYRFTG